MADAAADTIRPGDQIERWRVLREAPPAIRAGKLRRRFTCRCVCGRTERVLEVRDLAGRSTGCRSAACRSRWERQEASRATRNAVLDALQRSGATAAVIQAVEAAAKEAEEKAAVSRS